jgi:FHA domain-containing protein
MRLTAISRHASEDFLPFSAEFKTPGGTIGSCEGNGMVLPSPNHTICRLQAVLRVDETSWHLKNLSAMASVSVNGRSVPPATEVELHAGDTLAIGPYVLRPTQVN